MQIGIIGAGQVGGALGTNWAGKGHQVVFGVSNPADGKHAALKRRAGPNAAFATPKEAAAARVIALATPWDATEAAIRSLGDLAGKVVIDCTNPLGMTAGGLGLVLGFDESGGEKVAGWAKGATVFKTLNQVGFEVMADPSPYPVRPVMFVAGKDGADKSVVLGLVKDLGFEAIDAGPLEVARLLEPYAMVWINLALNRGLGRTFALGLMQRG